MSKDIDLIRIEQKLDLIIRALQSTGVMIHELPQLSGIEEDTCVLCEQPIALTVDSFEGRIQRTCGCTLPKTAYKLTFNTQQTKEAHNAHNRTEKDAIPPYAEE